MNPGYWLAALCLLAPVGLVALGWWLRGSYESHGDGPRLRVPGGDL